MTMYSCPFNGCPIQRKRAKEVMEHFRHAHPSHVINLNGDGFQIAKRVRFSRPTTPGDRTERVSCRTCGRGMQRGSLPNHYLHKHPGVEVAEAPAELVQDGIDYSKLFDPETEPEPERVYATYDLGVYEPESEPEPEPPNVQLLVEASDYRLTAEDVLSLVLDPVPSSLVGVANDFLVAARALLAAIEA